MFLCVALRTCSSETQYLPPDVDGSGHPPWISAGKVEPGRGDQLRGGASALIPQQTGRHLSFGSDQRSVVGPGGTNLKGLSDPYKEDILIKEAPIPLPVLGQTGAPGGQGTRGSAT